MPPSVALPWDSAQRSLRWLKDHMGDANRSQWLSLGKLAGEWCHFGVFDFGEDVSWLKTPENPMTTMGTRDNVPCTPFTPPPAPRLHCHPAPCLYCPLHPVYTAPCTPSTLPPASRLHCPLHQVYTAPCTPSTLPSAPRLHCTEPCCFALWSQAPCVTWQWLTIALCVFFWMPSCQWGLSSEFAASHTVRIYHFLIKQGIMHIS